MTPYLSQLFTFYLIIQFCSFLSHYSFAQTLSPKQPNFRWIRLGNSHDTCYGHHEDFRSQVRPRLSYFQALGQSQGLTLKNGPQARPIPQSEIIVQYDAGFDANPDAKAAFQFAVDIWASELVSPVPIVIDARFSNLGANVLGSASPGAIYTTLNGPNPNTAYVVALANAIDGVDIEPSNPDVFANFSSTANWYYGLDGNTPLDKFDFVSVVLHELGHGLGFTGNANSGTGVGFGNGSFPMSYDELVELGDSTTILSLGYASSAQQNALIGDNLFQAGTYAKAALGGQRPKMYAPNPFNTGSSFSHLDESTFPTGDPNSLMTPFIANGEAIHDIGEAVRGIYKDQGWRFVDELTFPDQDVGIYALVSPDVSVDSFQANAQVSLQITVANFGNLSQANIPLGFQLDNNNLVMESLNLTLESQRMLDYTFSLALDLSDASRSYNLTVFTGLLGDTNPDNDTLHILLNPVFDQKGDLAEVLIESQIFPNLGSSFLEAADDFPVNFGETLSLNTVEVKGFQPADSSISEVVVSIYSDSLNQPGALIAEQTLREFKNRPNFLLSLDTSIVLNYGHYWISVRPRLNSTSQWFWFLHNSSNHNTLYFRDPDNLKGQGLTDWTGLSSDLAFGLGGIRSPVVPQALEAGQIGPRAFIAHWEAIPGASTYQLDVSSDNFSTFVLENEVIDSTQTQFEVTSLQANTPYQYRIRYTGTNFVSLNSNVIQVSTCPEPSLASRNLVFENGLDSTGRLLWQAGDGQARMVLIKAGSDFTPTDLPQDGRNYQANSFVGAGDAIGSARVVYQGTGREVLLNGLDNGQSYFARAFEWTCPENKVYLSDDSSSVFFTKTNCVPPLQNAQNLQLSQVGAQGLQISWSPGDGSERLVLVKKSQTFSAPDLPLDGQRYQADTSFGQGSAIGDAFVVYQGQAQALTISGLNPDTSYFAAVVELNCPGNPLYRRDSLAIGSKQIQACTRPSQSASDITLQSLGTEQLQIEFNQGDGTHRMVLLKSRTSFESSDYPVDAQVYTADATLGQGSQIGQASVVYLGQGRQAQISGLASGQIYYLLVVEFNCPDVPKYRIDEASEVNTLVTASAEYISPEGFRVYPLPSQDIINIDWAGTRRSAQEEFTLLDLRGQVIQKGLLNNLGSEQIASLSLKTLPAGTYILGLPGKQGTTQYVRVVKAE